MKFFHIPSPPDINNCVFKLIYGTKYVIVKAKNVKGTCSAIQKGLNQFMRGSDTQNTKDNLYFHLYQHIKDFPNKEFSIKVLLQDDNIFRLLKYEHQQLEKVRLDKNCLNNNTEPYIPLFNEETDQYGWIPKTAYMSYRSWLKRRKIAV